MAENKGKPSGKDAESKSDAGRKGDLKRGPWPEEARHQRVQPGEDPSLPDAGGGRNKKAGAP